MFGLLKKLSDSGAIKSCADFAAQARIQAVREGDQMIRFIIDADTKGLAKHTINQQALNAFIGGVEARIACVDFENPNPDSAVLRQILRFQKGLFAGIPRHVISKDTGEHVMRW